MVYTYNVILAIQKNKIMSLAAIWMVLEVVKLSGLSQTQKSKYHMTFLTCGI